MANPVKKRIKRIIMKKGSYKCVNCGLKGKEVRFDRGGYGYPTDIEGIYLSIDHIFPKSKGGSSEAENLRILCTKCNRLKGVKFEKRPRKRFYKKKQEKVSL